MKKKEKELFLLYKETFSTSTNGLPGGWFVEQNTDMPQVPAIQCGDKCVELLSAGNKFLPLIPDTVDCHVSFSAKVNYGAAEQFGIILCFRYDVETGEGQYVRFQSPLQSNEVVIDYGTTRGNVFTKENSRTITAKRAIFEKEMEFELAISGNTLDLTLFQKEKVSFGIKEGKGKIAFAREHFWDVLKITSLEILGETKVKGKSVSFTIPYPDTPTWYPLYCDVTLTDYGNCLDADLSIHGGVAETVVGEGNYHGIRSDILTRPYLKVLTEKDTRKHVVYGKTLVLVPPGIAPKYLYKVIYEEPQWPFRRKVRFMKPAGEYNLAVGFENYHHNTLPDLEMDFAETVFTPKGKVLYSGSSIEEQARRVIKFKSQDNKEIIKKLPKKDPRYDMAVKFAEENHYFMEKEKASFKITISSASELPALYEVILEDAFLREVKQLDFETRMQECYMGVKKYNCVEITVETLKNLACGIWHLRVRSLDPSAEALEEYCTFEVMSKKEGSPAPSILSGLPFLYDSRTETRGLMTDAFDPWKNTQMNNGHYISCANFLPPAARKYQVYPTTKAYGRKNFAWIGSRCLDDWSIEGNMDIINEADYINISQQIPCTNLTWSNCYSGERLRILIDFLTKIKDPEFDIAALKKHLKENSEKTISPEITRKVFEKYWEEWQDFANEAIAKMLSNIVKKLRKTNPKLALGQYGPFHIYAGHLKGPECVRMLCNEKMPPDLHGFWQYEDYPISCGYGFERGLYTLTACLMAMPGSSIYPEIYTGGKLKQGCPDGAVFYAHPPFGISWKERSPKTLKRQIANFVFASGHLTKEGFRFWEKRGFQACRFTQKWFESILTMWPYVLEHAPERPARTAAYISSEDSRRAQKEVMIEVTHGVFVDTRKTATEDVPYIYECALKAGVPAGFQMFDKELDKLTPSQVDTLVLPPLKGMSKKAIQKIRALHEAGVNLLGNEDVTGLEDLFGVKNTGKKKCITKVTPTGDFCAGLSEYCDDERCQGSYVAKGADVLLAAEIPVLTIKHNKKASAAFFNVPPHLVREERLKQRMGYGRTGISSLIETAIGELMKSFSGTGINISAGRLIACHTKDGKVLVIVANPDDEKALSVKIAIDKALGVKGDPDVNFDVTLLKDDKEGRTYRTLIPEGEVLMMLYDKQK